jgi:hypothetical protein
MRRFTRLQINALMLALQIELLGLKVWLRETLFWSSVRHFRRMGFLAYAVDLEDDDVKSAIQAAVDEAVKGLKDNNRQLQADLRKAKAKASDGNIDPAELERLEAEVDRLKGELTTATKTAKDATKRAETAETSLTAEQAHTQKLLVDNGLAAALTEAGVTNPMMHKAAAALLRTGNKIDIAVDGENRVAKIGDKGLGDFVKAWAQGDEGKAFVAAPGNGGGGAHGNGKPGGPANPWAKESFNMTEQGKLLQSNPTLARSMAAEHGVNIT